MKALHLFVWASASVIGLSILGCRHDRGETVVYQESPEPAYVVVPQPPPQIIVEERPAPPGPTYVWIDGYWHWNGHKYGWHRGGWTRPPQGRGYWVAPRYERYEHGYRYQRGYWSHEQQEHREHGHDHD
jgi:hypothetical protein